MTLTCGSRAWELNDEQARLFEGMFEECELLESIDDYEQNMPCDNTGLCGGTDCSNWNDCKWG